MRFRWIFLVYFLSVHLKNITSHHYHQRSHEHVPEQYYEEADPMEYEDSSEFTRRQSKRHKKYHNRPGSNECVCDCNSCNNPKPCCVEMCNYCPVNPADSVDPAIPGADQDQNRIVFVPYPYPLVVPNVMFKTNNSNANEDAEPTTMQEPDTTTKKPTTTTTTTARTTTAAAPTTEDSAITETTTSEPFELRGMLSGHRNMKDLNPSVKRRVRPAWVPKYGIVPIPDHLAAKLMSQLTEVRALKTKRI